MKTKANKTVEPVVEAKPSWYDLAVANAAGESPNAAFDNNAPIVFGKALEAKVKTEYAEYLFNAEFLQQVRKECMLRNYLNDRPPYVPAAGMQPAYYIQERDVTSAIEALDGLNKTSKA